MILDLSASLPLRLLVGGSGPAAGAPEVVAVVPRRRWRLVAVTLDLDRDRVLLRWRHDDVARSLDSQLQWQWLLLLGSLWRWRHDDGARSHGALVEERLLELLLPELLSLAITQALLGRACGGCSPPASEPGTDPRSCARSPWDPSPSGRGRWEWAAGCPRALPPPRAISD